MKKEGITKTSEVEDKVQLFNEETLVEFIERANRTEIGKPISEKLLHLELSPYQYGCAKDIHIKAKYGAGRASRIPYMAFLGPQQKVSNGIYPVFLFYKEKNILILAYGISADNPPAFTWGSVIPSNSKTIGQWAEILKLGIDPRYNASNVARIWRVDFDSEGKVINSTAKAGHNTTIFPFHAKDAISVFTDVYNRYEGMLLSNGIIKDSNNNSGNQEQINQYGVDDSIPKNEDMEEPKSDFDLNKVIETIASTNLLYDKELIRRYACALMTKPFVILSGLAGSGKTQLALAFAHAISADIDKQICFVAIGSDWTNREPLLGYANALNRDEYVRPENGVLDIILRANEDPSHPYFLILDEMNLSYVERYFADFLSAMESNKEIALWNNFNSEVPSKTSLPTNLFIIGTINVDETTYMFSPKVLDRASVLEFKISTPEMEQFLSSMAPTDIHAADGKCSSMSENFVKTSQIKKFENAPETNKILLEFFSSLKEVNAEFGYRSASEIFRYIFNHNSHPFENETPSERMDKAIDAAIIQKLLPKLHGSRKRVVPVLKKLWITCYYPNITNPTPLDEYNEASIDMNQFRYTLSADKILRMFNAALDNGFMSFAEA